MKSLSSVGIVLTVLFTFLFLALIAELFYLLRWKKKRPGIESHDYTNPAKYLFHIFCLKNHSPLNPQLQLCSSPTHPQNDSVSPQNDDDFLFKPFGDQTHYYPPRFLFTIVEETREELESEEAKSCNKSRNRSLSDLLVALETPYLTPLASPPFFTPPLTPGEFNFPFDSASEAESNRVIRSFSSPSPPSRFRFLREADEKLKKEAKREDDLGDEITEDRRIEGDYGEEEEEEESFITITVDQKNPKRVHCSNSSSYSQVIVPLSSSPSTFTR